MSKVNFSFVLCFGLLCVCLSACGSSPKKPAWVNSIDSVYSNDQYVAAVGTGNDRQMAEKSAFGNLIARFGQSIQVDEKISLSYQEAVKSGVTTGWTQDTNVQNTIATSASMDTLVGAEIKETWFESSTNTHYAAAVMEKDTAARLYTGMINANLTMINNLTSMSQAEKDTLEGFSRYQFAAMIADINTSYGNLLKVIGTAPPAGMKPGDDYRLEAVNITKAIPIAVTVKGDRAGRIQGAISRALADLGFRSGVSNSRYTVDAELSITEDVYPTSPYKWARYVVTASLVDTVPLRVVLVPFSISDREGQNTYDLAVNRALGKVEDIIAYDFKDLVNDYLSRLLPKK